MNEDQIYNFREIDEKVSTSGLLNELQLSELSSSGYEMVINLLPNETEYAVKNEKEIVEAQGIEYRYIPVDFENPKEQDYYSFVNAIRSGEGKKILIHCAANFRVTAFFGIYAYEHLGWSSSKALELIASVWKPEEHSPWEMFISNYIDGNG